MAHDKLTESMLLEAHGFRFIEMVYPMTCSAVQPASFSTSRLSIERAAHSDLEALQAIGASTFVTGRFNMDPSVGPGLGGKRYATWIENSFHSQSQIVVKAVLDANIAGVFVYENVPNNGVYWHLTAVSSPFQGGGIGTILWREMIMRHTQGRGPPIYRYNYRCAKLSGFKPLRKAWLSLWTTANDISLARRATDLAALNGSHTSEAAAWPE